MEAQDIPGIKKAAILLLTMDDELSKEIIKELEEENQKLKQLSASRNFFLLIFRLNIEFYL